MIETIPISKWQAILRECLIEKGLPADLVERFKLVYTSSLDFKDYGMKIRMSFDDRELDTYYIDPYQGDMMTQFVYVLREAVNKVQNDILAPKEQPVCHKRKCAKVTLASRFRPHTHYKPSWER